MTPEREQQLRGFAKTGMTDVAEVLEELDKVRGGRVTCRCGKDTAAVVNAQCYRCRNDPLWTVEELKSELASLRAAAGAMRSALEAYEEAFDSCGAGSGPEIEAVQRGLEKRWDDLRRRALASGLGAKEADWKRRAVEFLTETIGAGHGDDWMRRRAALLAETEAKT